MEMLELLEAAQKVTGATKAVVDVAKSVIEITGRKTVDHDILKERVSKLLETVLDLQQAQMLLSQQNQSLIDAQSAYKQRITELEEEIRRFDAFDREAENYELASVGPDAHVYRLKPSTQSNGTAHDLCVACYGKRKKSVLQFQRYEPNTNVLRCNDCGAEVHKRIEERNTVMFAPARKPSWDI